MPIDLQSPPREPRTAASPPSARPGNLLPYLLLGILFGFVLVRGEVISWFRIQEMFRFQAFHMFGVFATALAVVVPLFALLRRTHARALNGEPITLPPKVLGGGYRYALGGLLFGVGWAFTGACPGPLLALIGAGVGTMTVALLSALAGTWVYGHLRPRLPH